MNKQRINMLESLLQELKVGKAELVQFLQLQGRLQIRVDGHYEHVTTNDILEHTYVLRVKVGRGNFYKDKRLRTEQVPSNKHPLHDV